MSKQSINVSPQLRLETASLLGQIKLTFPMFFIDPKYYNETIEAWASHLRGLEGFLLEGLRLWVEDVSKRSGGSTPPSVADVRKYADIAKRKQASELMHIEYDSIDPEDCLSYVNANKEISEEEQLRNEAGHYAKLQALEDRLTADQKAKGYRSWRTGRHFPDKDFSSVQDLPFVPDEEDLPK